MPSKHLIIVVISFFTFAFIYSSSFTFDVFAVPPDDRFGGKDSNCTTDYSKDTKTCCWRERVPGQILGKTYCQTCDSDGKICKEKVLQFTGPSDLSRFEGNILEEATPPSDQSRFPTKGGLLGLLDETNPTIQPGDDNTIPPKSKGGLLGLLDETNPTIQQQPLPESTTPQRNIPNDLLSNLDDNLFTNVPKQNEPLNLLEENEQQESSPIKETDSDNANTVKDDDKEDNEKEEDKQQPSSAEQLEDKQPENFANQENEIQSEETTEQEEDDSNEEGQEQLQPPIAETFSPNEDLDN